MTKNPPAGGVTIGLTDQQIVLGARALAQAMFDMAMKGGAPEPIAVPVPAGPAPAYALASLPAIGAEVNGEIYAGLSIHHNEVVALWLMPGDEKMTWKEAMTWAENKGGVLPSRIDQLVLFKNVKAQFKEEWYWSGEQHAADSVYAWGQGFGSGSQSNWHEDDGSRARAVRRSVIQ